MHVILFFPESRLNCTFFIYNYAVIIDIYFVVLQPAPKWCYVNRDFLSIMLPVSP